MKINMGGDTFTIDEDIVIEEVKNILYEAGRIQLNSVNKSMTIHALQNAARRVKSKEMKMIIAELIVTLSTSDSIQFIKEDTK